MANWIIAAHERWFSDFFQMLRRELLSSEILHADETTLMVLKEPGRKAQQKSYVWVYRISGDAEHPVVLYDYQPSRAGECASRFLEGFSGLLHTDGYGARVPLQAAARNNSSRLLGAYAMEIHRYAEKPAQ